MWHEIPKNAQIWFGHIKLNSTARTIHSSHITKVYYMRANVIVFDFYFLGQIKPKNIK